MEIERKKQLLKYCESLMKDLKEYDSLSFFGFLANTAKHYASQKKPLNEYHQMMYLAMLQGSNVIGENKATYKKFIKEQLKCSKQGQVIKIGDKVFNGLTMDEIAYIFGWLRRLSSNKKDENGLKQSNKKESYNKNYVSKSKGLDKEIEDNPFAIINKVVRK
ncbi:hypothetical protein [Cellulosilyticum ruminicola]|uniref:hypothetical protein n=1 Tax=Cellulosilyticum ruminicola TaxID=425254 RepID=UPI0006D08721|nr:hypothetical protein [Cellulosilyticum ruminicola]